MRALVRGGAVWEAHGGLAVAASCSSQTSAGGAFHRRGVERGSPLFVCQRVVVSLVLFWKSAAPSRDSGAWELSPGLFGGAFLFLLSLMLSPILGGQSMAAWGTEVQDRPSCMPSPGNYWCNTG